jgi:hypothetical protein
MLVGYYSKSAIDEAELSMNTFLRCAIGLRVIACWDRSRRSPSKHI